jgi:hypothetical protein
VFPMVDDRSPEFQISNCRVFTERERERKRNRFDKEEIVGRPRYDTFGGSKLTARVEWAGLQQKSSEGTRTMMHWSWRILTILQCTN